MNRRISLFCALALVGAIPSLGAAGGWTGSRVCGSCHADIYRRYAETPMSQSSGPATSAPVPEQSFSANSGYRYSIVHRDGKLVLEFRKAAAPAAEARELAWFVGSGAAARSYLTSVNGFLYEAPATFYNRTRAWGPSPGYERYSYPFLTRAIAPECLACHATGVQAIAGTQNGYQSPPFLEGGVGCERCHGPGAAHAASGKPADIVNPASLPAERRDSVCAQCHLSGEIRVDRAGKSMADFVAGGKLDDFAVAFVRDSSSRRIKVTSHGENLAQSACSRGSGARLWCGTCHDPHVVPAPSEKAAWFRSKCRTCHAAKVCVRGDNCIACHMPASSVSDADHVVYTDHSIPRRALARDPKASPASDAPLTAFGGAVASARELGLAYAIVALRERNQAYSARAFDLLSEALRNDPNDPQTLSYLADLYKSRKNEPIAADLYRRLYAAEPRQSAAAPMNLAAAAMEKDNNAEAVRLFEEALRISPALVLVRLDLAVALIRIGNPAEARRVLEKALVFNPDFAPARELLRKLQN